MIPSPTGPRVAGRLAAVRERIAAACRRAGRDPATVTLIAVSKAQPVSAVGEAADAGQLDFGESYVQEWLDKREALAERADLRWHFIGHLQSRKAREVVGRAALVHGVDRPDLATELDRRSSRAGLVTPCLLQVNVGGEATKGGFDPHEVPGAAAAVAALPGLSLRGLMAIPPPVDDPEEARPYFRMLADLRDRARRATGLPLPELSMGMSGDYEVAVEEGATLVRVGTAIFGDRPPRPGAQGEKP